MNPINLRTLATSIGVGISNTALTFAGSAWRPFSDITWPINGNSLRRRFTLSWFNLMFCTSALRSGNCCHDLSVLLPLQTPRQKSRYHHEWLIHQPWEFLGIPRKLGIQLAGVICIIGNFWEFLGIRNSQKTGNSVRKGRGGVVFCSLPCQLFSVCNPFSFLPNMRGSQAPP